MSKQAPTGHKSKKVRDVTKRLTKSELLSKIAEVASLKKRDVVLFMEALAEVVKAELVTCGEVVLPNVAKIRTTVKPATPAHPGINPFTKEAITVAAKPESRRVRFAAIKSLKDAVK